MDTIASFQVDHTNLQPGIYTSRVDGDIVTYDVRMRRPNKEPVLLNASIHTIEHLFATYVRNSEFKDEIIYFGPMGCRTGFYFIVRGMTKENVLTLTKRAFLFIGDYAGEIPGTSARECGNYREHDLNAAKNDAKDYLNSLDELTVENMQY